MNPSGKTILHVEDDMNDVLLISRAFRKAEIPANVQVLHDGEEALHYLSGVNSFSERERFPLPSLILLDLKLPRRSGLEVVQWVRSQPGLRRIPIVMLTSSRQPLDINHAYDAGVNAYLVKPVDFDSLVELLKTVDGFWLKSNEQPTAIQRPT